MNTPTNPTAAKKKWEKPLFENMPICFEATCYDLHLGDGS